jgi:putative zinc finger/helix-turn-helix YgiT family protein
MTCVKCRGQLLAPAPGPMTATIKGEAVEFVADVPRCSECGTVFVFGKALDKVNRLASDAYRSRHGLMTSADVLAAKKRLGLSWAKFADFVGVSLVQIKRWLSGAIQSTAMDQLVRFKTDLAAIESHAAMLRALEGRAVTISVPLGAMYVAGQPGTFMQTTVVFQHQEEQPSDLRTTRAAGANELFVGDLVYANAIASSDNAGYKTPTPAVSAANAPYLVAA